MSRADFIAYLKETDARFDQHLDLYRVETHALKRLASMSDRAFLAIGLKGVGKTACFFSMQSADDVDFVQAISAETQDAHDLATSRPTLQYVPEIRSELVLQALITIATKLKANPTLNRKIPSDIHQEINILTTNIWGKLKEIFGGLGGITILGCGISFRNRNKKDPSFKLVAREEYDKALSILERLSKAISFRIVVDDPEAIFATDDRINENLIAALAIAAHELQTRLSNFKCLILIKPNVLRALRRVDEFVNLPLDSRVRLSWTDDELKDVIRLRAKAASVDLKNIFRADPEVTLTKIVNDSRSGPRDALRRLSLHLDAFPNEPVTPESLEKTIDIYSEACFEQMHGAYERQFPGLSRASIILFEGRELSIPKSNIRDRLDQMIASKNEILAFKNETWARDAAHFSDLIVEFGLVAIQTSHGKILPFHANFLDEAAKSDAVFTFIPGLRGKLRKPSAGPSQTGGEKRGR
jgi:hypothetical protein